MGFVIILTLLIAVIAGLDISELIVSTKYGKVLLLQSPSLLHASEEDIVKNVAPIEPGSPREAPNVFLLFEGQYGSIRALSTHPSLNLFALGGDSGNYYSLT